MWTLFMTLFGQNAYWRHHLILVVLGSVILLVGYFFIYKASGVECRAYTQAYHAMQLKMKLLKQHTSKQPNKTELCHQLASMEPQRVLPQNEDMDAQIIALVQKTELSLDQIQPIDQGEQSGWLLRLHGDYYQFLHLLDHLVQSRLPLSIDYAEAESNADQLVFLLRLTLE